MKARDLKQYQSKDMSGTQPDIPPVPETAPQLPSSQRSKASTQRSIPKVSEGEDSHFQMIKAQSRDLLIQFAESLTEGGADGEPGLLDLDYSHLSDSQQQQVRSLIEGVRKVIDDQCEELSRLRYVIAGEHSNGKSWLVSKLHDPELAFTRDAVQHDQICYTSNVSATNRPTRYRFSHESQDIKGHFSGDSLDVSDDTPTWHVAEGAYVPKGDGPGKRWEFEVDTPRILKSNGLRPEIELVDLPGFQSEVLSEGGRIDLGPRSRREWQKGDTIELYREYFIEKLYPEYFRNDYDERWPDVVFWLFSTASYSTTTRTPGEGLPPGIPCLSNYLKAAGDNINLWHIENIWRQYTEGVRTPINIGHLAGNHIARMGGHIPALCCSAKDAPFIYAEDVLWPRPPTSAQNCDFVRDMMNLREPIIDTGYKEEFAHAHADMPQMTDRERQNAEGIFDADDVKYVYAEDVLEQFRDSIIRLRHHKLSRWLPRVIENLFAGLDGYFCSDTDLGAMLKGQAWLYDPSGVHEDYLNVKRMIIERARSTFQS